MKSVSSKVRQRYIGTIAEYILPFTVAVHNLEKSCKKLQENSLLA